MREFNMLINYPQPSERAVGSRTIESRIVASERGVEFFDGHRDNGYGGFKYDGRWNPVAAHMIVEYGLTKRSAILQLGCEKGFLLHEFLALVPSMMIWGTETSRYAKAQAMSDVQRWIKSEPYTNISFGFQQFDLVIALGCVYTLNLADAIKCLKEIQRVGKRAFITLGVDSPLMRKWSLLGCTLLSKEEWVEVMKHAGYTGDYKFNTAESLKLRE